MPDYDDNDDLLSMPDSYDIDDVPDSYHEMSDIFDMGGVFDY